LDCPSNLHPSSFPTQGCRDCNQQGKEYNRVVIPATRHAPGQKGGSAAMTQSTRRWGFGNLPKVCKLSAQDHPYGVSYHHHRRCRIPVAGVAGTPAASTGSGDLRVLYNVERTEVALLAVGRKVGNKLIVKGAEFHGHKDHPPEPSGDEPRGDVG
jgi:hypothetical protein